MPVDDPEPANPPPAEVALGKRLFRETRFAQYFALRAGAEVNHALPEGDPVVDSVDTPAGTLASPYRGLSMNCASCHLSDELIDQNPMAARALADFRARSPVPDRGDGHKTTTRNAASLMEALLPGEGVLFLHHDGEHTSAEDLVVGSLTGRNFGWLTSEHAMAVIHIANVIRRDAGTDVLASQFGRLPYRVVFAGTDPAIRPSRRLPESYRLDVATATDQQVVGHVGRLITAYLAHQKLGREPDGSYSRSPYDRFLRKNGLPPQPDAGEKLEEYGRRLYTMLVNLPNPAFVSDADGRFERQSQPFVFGPVELAGLVTFLGKPGEPPSGPPGLWTCSTCHPPPHFKDQRFHNIGVTEAEYDRVHGPGSFAALPIPTLEQRRKDEAAYLPPSPRLPTGTSVFRGVPTREHPGRTDLGLWNTVLNDDVPAVQSALQTLLCPAVLDAQGNCNQEDLLAHTIASFRTRGLRDLGHSGPYFHNGMAATLEEVVTHYVAASIAVKNTQLRNGAIALEWLTLSSSDIPTLAAFLRSLNED